MVTFTADKEARALVWTLPEGWVGLSSASVGGGLIRPRWVVNLDVGDDFTRTDLDAYASARAAGLRLSGPGTTLLTAADVTQVERSEDAGTRVWATVGVTKPTWAVPPHDVSLPEDAGPGVDRPGTINIVVVVPVPLSGSALVQAVGTVTEAKAQALVEAGVPGTGTASDAVVVLCPEQGAEPEIFAGVRSRWGRRIATATHACVAAGLAARPWGSDAAGVRW
ncbi:adenosylcobinamide amidohydrolase [Serinicoccus kebangsaanensis]|uniref:adenosylcobinamide amidohydrolase n=1 Tax=Serinicoccus kebangsaanensis TaxID=2602069 RepID=UPI00124E9625|nr:adenosylcobinamide amidohydrolase [Serinicoccus kebangsaanensis]